MLLGAGEDVFDTRDGTIQGVVCGGADNDTFKIANSKIKIVEANNGGDSDRVFSTVSYTLGAEVDELHLKGGRISCSAATHSPSKKAMTATSGAISRTASIGFRPAKCPTRRISARSISSRSAKMSFSTSAMATGW